MNVTIWNENTAELITKEGVMEKFPEITPEELEKRLGYSEKVREVHPNGIHGTLKDLVSEIPEANVTTATLDQENCGLSDEVLNNTDVLIWWSHISHDEVPDELVEKIHERVLKGMGLILLHSSHYSKIMKKTLGTTCDLRWRDDTYERLFCVNPAHPIAQGVPENFELGIEESYGERFDIPAPDEIIFLGWFDIGEVFRSGCTWTRGYGKIFYFQPGHETNLSYFHPHIRTIVKNAVNWANPAAYRADWGAPHIDVTLEEARKTAE